MAISRKEIEKMAFLARLELNEVEIKKYQEQLSSVLGYIDTLKEVDCSDLDILGLDLDGFNKVRVDEVVHCSPEEIKLALDQSPDKEGEFIKVNRVI